MKKLLSLAAALVLTACLFTMPVSAADNGALGIDLVSPGGASEKPVYEETVVSTVTNYTQEPMENLLVYLTIIDTKNNIAVAVDEYGATADKPRIIETLAPGESVDVEIPIRFMYVGDFELYTSVMDKSGGAVVSTAPISLFMLGDSQVNPTYVLVVSIAVPALLILVSAWLAAKQKRRTKG